MTELHVETTTNNLWCGTGYWGVYGPRNKSAPQIVGLYSDRLTAAIDADDIDLLIEALATVRDAMKEEKK